VDKAFWHHATGSIRAFGPAHLALKKFSLTAGSALGRFIRRS